MKLGSEKGDDATLGLDEQKVRSSQNRVNGWFLSASSKLGLSKLPFQVYTLLGMGLLFSLGRNIAFPYLAMYLTAENTSGGLQIDPSLVGLMIMASGFVYMFSLLATGNLCDKFGRRKMMLVFMIPQTVLTMSYVYASTALDFFLLFIATNIIGAFYDPAHSAMIADLVQPSRREEVYGLSYMIANIGTIVGPPIGGFIASVSGYPMLFVYAAIFTAVCAGITLILIKETYTEAESSRVKLAQLAGIFRDRIFILFCVSAALTNVVYSQLYGLLSVYTVYVGLEPYVFGMLFSVNGAMVVALQIPIRKAVMRFGSVKAFIIAQTLYAVGFSCFMISRDFLQFLTGVVVLTLGEIIFVPASSGFIANLSPADMRGRYMALGGLFFGTGASLGSLIGFGLYGVLPDKAFVWGILGVMGFATLPCYFALLRIVHTRKM